MIYIIDEKTKRQSSYGWNAQRFEKYEDVIIRIDDYSCFESERFVDKVLSERNVVLFHESFFDGIAQDKRVFANEFRRKLDGFGKNGMVVYYGGSKSSRKIEGNVAYLPVSVMYQHLETYLIKTTSGNADINYLIWGENPLIEKFIIEKIADANQKMLDDLSGYDIVSCNALVVVSADKNQLYIPDTNPNIIVKELFPDNESDDPISDKLLHSYVLDWFQEKEYDVIALPLCFGPALSDYNGLRLALHIRCTQTQNQYKPIYLYGVVGCSYLINNEFFDVLRTKEVYLVDYDNKSILSSLTIAHKPIGPEILSNELKRVKLNLPENYIDSHSIANEWAIYRWAKTIGTTDADINEVVKNVETNLYFKYLNTICPIPTLHQLTKKDLIIQTNCNEKPRVLLIDDEAEKGWYKIFSTILYDVNGFCFSHLDDELNEKNPDEIVQIVHEKIVSNDIDIVVLDYRLHRSDFFAERTEDITGYKVLKDIKNKINRGIQVIVLSATNKVWNWESLKEIGVDGFIMKDNPDGHFEETSSINGIKKLVDTFGNCSNRLFLKQFYKNYNTLEKCFLPRGNFRIAQKPLPKDFVDETMKWFKLSCDILISGITEETKASSFLFLFSVIENIANYIVDIDNPIDVIDEERNIVWQYKFRTEDRFLMSFNSNMKKTQFYFSIPSGKTIPWSQKLLNTLDFISVTGVNKSIIDLVDKRNDFIHANATTGKRIEITPDDLKKLHDIVFNGLKNI